MLQSAGEPIAEPIAEPAFVEASPSATSSSALPYAFDPAAVVALAITCPSSGITGKISLLLLRPNNMAVLVYAKPGKPGRFSSATRSRDQYVRRGDKQ